MIAIADPESWAPIDEAIARLERYAWLVLTSANGAERFFGRLQGRGLPEHVRTAVVGTATARALERFGVTPQVIPPAFRGAALPGAMAPLLRPGDRVLMPRGDLADPALAERLQALGAVVDDLVVYRTVPDRSGDLAALLADLEAGAIHYATFTSGSTVTNLLHLLGNPALLRHTRVACIGPETERAAAAAGLTPAVVAAEATLDGLVEAIIEDTLQGGR